MTSSSIFVVTSLSKLSTLRYVTEIISVYGCLHVIYVVVIGNGKDVFVLNKELIYLLKLVVWRTFRVERRLISVLLFLPFRLLFLRPHRAETDTQPLVVVDGELI